MRKRLLTMALTLCMVLALLPTTALAVDAHVSLASLEYKKDSSGNVTITDCAEGARGVLEIPSTIDGGKVVAIGENAFYECDQITQAILPGTVTKIGGNAFRYCSALTGIVIPDSVTEVGNYAFASSGIQSAVVGKGVKTLRHCCFNGCGNLSQVTLSSGLEEIGSYAFEGCASLTSIALPNTLKTVGSTAFKETGLTSVALPASVQTVGDSAFYLCESLQSLTLNNGLTTIGDYAFSRTSLETVVIPDSVTYLGDGAFAYITTLRSVTVGSGIEKLGIMSFCFSSNKALETLIFREGIKAISGNAVGGCPALKTLYLPGSLVEIDAGSFNSSNSIQDIYYGGTAYGWGGVAIGKDNGNILSDSVTMHYVPFRDTKAGDYYYDPMVWAIDRGITNGTSDTTFSPGLTCKQCEILTFLYRAVGSPAVTGGSAYTNTAVTPDKYYYNALLWAYQQGVVTDKALDPTAPCTRADVVTYLWRLAGKPAASGSAFSDVPSSAIYAQAVAWAVKQGITDGTSDTTFSPNNTCTRAQIVTFLYRDLA